MKPSGKIVFVMPYATMTRRQYAGFRTGIYALRKGKTWGARDFDKVILSRPIPPFDRSNKLHMALSRAAAHAEQIASAVQLNEGMHFITARKKIRAALDEDGISQKIDKLVAELLEADAITPE